MKLFFREHFLLIAVQIVQFIAFCSIYWLDGYHYISPAVYGVFLSFFFLGCYLFYYYYSRRKFYGRLSNPLETLDDSFQKTEQAPISEAFDNLLRDQYRHYQNQIKKLEHDQGSKLSQTTISSSHSSCFTIETPAPI